ncbi:MAG: hypothetical protein GQ582_08240 [Methyloprofundus sp.]|nr:hypothetical protein [Methyloprofundus sp.]
MTRFTWLLILSILIPLPIQADSSTVIPEPLSPWVDWVMQDAKNYKCPFFYNNQNTRHCAWPSQLELTLKPQQGQFKSAWQVYNDSYITLPGSALHWPQNVTVNGQAALVLQRNKRPAVKLKAGNYTVQGDFLWDSTPDSLMIPSQSGLVSVRMLGKLINNPVINNNQLWFKASDIGGDKQQKSKADQLNLQVFRKLDDSIPLQLVTKLALKVSGKQREIKLDHALFKGFIPISLHSDLAARLEADGSLLVQIRPGRWEITLRARYPSELMDLSFAVDDPKWPESEIWSFSAKNYQRVVEVENVTAIDPSQSNVPREWKNLPAYQLQQGDTMHFKVIRRGDPEPEPNKLTLKRELWLDFAGTGYTVQDTIKGKITHGWRLDSLPETKLGHVAVNKKTLLITHSLDGQSEGVELRQGVVNLQADSRIESSSHSLSSTGWLQKFNQVSAELNLPPGWHLIAVSGVDNVPSSWVSRWTLLDLFLVLIAALAVSRLWNIYWGIFALITLALIWHEVVAPRLIWLNLLAAIALIRVLPEGKFLRMLQYYRGACSLALLMICVPFLVDQVRIGLYPQLENTWRQPMMMNQADSTYLMEEELSVASDSIRSVAKKSRAQAERAYGLSSYSAAAVSAPKLKQLDPDAQLQTGPGLPQWQWKQITLSWNGSVDSQQQIKFWYLNPTASLVLNFVRLLTVIILSLLMLGFIKQDFKFKRPSLAVNLCVLLLFILPITPVAADYPSPALLKELQQRLLKAPDCLPSCAQIASMALAIDKHTLTLTLQAHAQEKVAIPLPAKFKQWLPQSVLIDGLAAPALIQDQQGLLWVGLEAGIHTLVLSGVVPTQASFTLPLSLKPQYITYHAKHWALEGLRQNGVAENQLHLTRLKSVADKVHELPVLTQGELPAFIKIERTLNLGMDWYVRTQVSRLTRQANAVTLRVPLLKGESISSAHIRSEEGFALIHLSANQPSIEWHSLLEKTEQIKLTAPDTQQWTETWKANISPIWHIQSEGIAAIHHQDGVGNWLPTWQPWAKESVTLNITRPKAVQGQTLTIDKSYLELTAGKRSQEAQLDLDVRSSKAAQHVLQLPANVSLESVKINGQTQAIRQQQGSVTLPITPGKQHFQLNWHESKEQASVLSSPALNLGLASVNNHIKINLGRDRWVLLATGPQLGPAVLFWGILFVLAIVAFALGKSDLTPLKNWQWFLLLIGLSQIPLVAAFFVVAWLMALGLRKQKITLSVDRFNLIQIVLVLSSLAALAILFIAVKQGLLGRPDMQILGNQSTATQLNWYQDRSLAILPTATVVSISLTAYRVLMLLWSLWLAISLLNWLKWGWECFSYQGLWKKSEPKQEAEKEEGS